MPPKKGCKGGKLAIFKLCDDDDAPALGTLLTETPEALESRNGDGWTPLMAAAFAGAEECAALLLRAGANVRAECKDRDTALHYASAQGHMDVVRLLAAAGARLDVEDEDGDTPAKVALNLKTRKLIEQLIVERDAGGGGGAGEGEEEEEEAEEDDEDDEQKCSTLNCSSSAADLALFRDSLCAADASFAASERASSASASFCSVTCSSTAFAAHFFIRAVILSRSPMLTPSSLKSSFSMTSTLSSSSMPCSANTACSFSRCN